MSKNGSSPLQKIDTVCLRQLYRSDDAAKALFDHLAKRTYNKKELPVERLALNVANEGSAASRRDITRVLKELEKAGCGKYILGRRGHQSRFQPDPKIEMVAVGRYASGQTAAIDDANPSVSSEAEALDTQDASMNGSGELAHRFQLRPHLLVSIMLPADLTSAEAGRLADFIRTLPF